MKNQRGVTLTTLTIYIIVSTILLVTLAFINVNFMSELSELTKRSKNSSEILMIYSFFVNDVKSANSVVEFSESHLRFDNGVTYTIKYRANSKTYGEQAYDVYEIYRDSKMITDQLSGAFFRYEAEDQYVVLKLSMMENNVVKSEEQFFKVGRGY